MPILSNIGYVGQEDDGKVSIIITKQFILEDSFQLWFRNFIRYIRGRFVYKNIGLVKPILC